MSPFLSRQRRKRPNGDGRNPQPAGGRPGSQAGRRTVLVLALALAAAGSCRLGRLERGLGPQSADFYWKVQVIITSEERKIFLELPESERPAFIEEFWKRRDPDPETPENPFRTEYESRVEQAARLFGGEGRPGYLTDRGRIYLQFGPPWERLTYPMDQAGFCREVWYYGGFPVIFIDERCEGHFVLTTVSLEHLQKLNIAQRDFQRTFEPDKAFFDYTVTVLKGRTGGAGRQGTIVLEVPYAAFWFDVNEGGGLETSLDVRLEARTASGDRIWEFQKTYGLALGEDELKTKKGLSYRIEIPIVLPGTDGRSGRLTLHAALRNGAEGEELKKVLELRL